MSQRLVTAALSLTTVFAVGAGISLSSQPAQASHFGGFGGFCALPTPDGYDKVFTFMANGVTDITDTGQQEDPIAWFQEGVMGRTPAEVEADRQAALDLFSSRFGVDAENDPRIFFTPFALTPEVGYRAYTSSGERVNRRGWEVRDGGWAAFVVDPAGITLGGEFAGQQVGPNTAFVWGDYNIAKSTYWGYVYDEEIIHYFSQEPISIQPDNSLKFNCQLNSDRHGPGIAQGIQDPVFDPIAGTTTWNTRNILTFNANGGL